MTAAPKRASGMRRGSAAGRQLGLLVIATLVAVIAYYWTTTLGFETTDDAFVDGTLSYLAAEVTGRVLEVAVRENERVTAGQLLVRLDPEEAAAGIARARADLAVARNRMVSAEAAAAAADAEGKAATVQSWRTGRELTRAKSLAQSGAASDQQLDAARASHDAALAKVHALAMHAEAERGLLGSEAPILQAEAAIREAEILIERTRLVAPFDAVVGRRSVEVGDIVRPGQALLALSRIEPRWIEANFKETQIRKMRPGTKATVEIDAFPDYVFHGHIQSFSPASGARYALIPQEPAVGNFTKVVQRLPVRIVLDEVEDGQGRRPVAEAEDLPDLAIGLSAFVRVDVR